MTARAVTQSTKLRVRVRVRVGVEALVGVRVSTGN